MKLFSFILILAIALNCHYTNGFGLKDLYQELASFVTSTAELINLHTKCEARQNWEHCECKPAPAVKGSKTTNKKLLTIPLINEDSVKANISWGTPPTKVTVLFDSGGVHSWLQKPPQSNISKTIRYYDRRQSSSFLRASKERIDYVFGKGIRRGYLALDKFYFNRQFVGNFSFLYVDSSTTPDIDIAGAFGLRPCGDHTSFLTSL